MWARQRINQCVHVYLLTQQESGPGISPYDVAPGPFIALVHVPCDIMNDVIV